MKLRRFTDAGIAKTRAFLVAVKEANNVDNVTLDGAPFTRATLLSSPAYSEAIPALADLDLDETRTFDTTFAFCEYFDSLIHDHCKVVLWHNLNTYNDLVEQILSRQFVVQNPALLKAANTLYFDLNVGKAKPGAAGDGAGGVRRFIVLVDQLARTRDFFDMEDYEVFIQMLPKEFERFKRLRV